MQRFVRLLELENSDEAVKAYRKAHDEIWPEITAGIKSVGITRMDLYLLGYQAVMIMELPDDVDVSAAMSRLATLPRQQEWEEYVGQWQKCEAGATSDGKWKDMTKIFNLPL